MRSTPTILASSVFFSPTTPAFSTSGQYNIATTAIAIFASPGSIGGPTAIAYGIGVAMQGNFGGNGNPSSGSYGGTFQLLGSNVLEAPMFVPVTSAIVSSTGSVMLRDQYPWYRYVDFKFIPSLTSSTGFVTVALFVKGNT